MMLTDPSVLFALNVIIAPLLIVNYPQTQLDLSKEYLTHPPIVITVILWLLIEIIAAVSSKSKTSITARWYLINAIFFHGLLDPICGIFQAGGLMSQQYAILDKRYTLPFDHEGLIVHLVSLLELVLMAPICLLIYYGYHQNYKNSTDKIWIYCLEIIVSTLQLTGTFFYNGQELIHIVRGDGLEIFKVDYKLEFTFDYIFYFWFGAVVAQLPWIIVPCYMIKRAYNDIKRAV